MMRNCALRSPPDLLVLRQVQLWVYKNYRNAVGSDALSRAFESAEADLVSWFDKYYYAVFDWLAPYNPTPPSSVAPPSSSVAPASSSVAPTGQPTSSTTAKPGNSAYPLAMSSGLLVLLAALLSTMMSTA